MVGDGEHSKGGMPRLAKVAVATCSAAVGVHLNPVASEHITPRSYK